MKDIHHFLQDVRATLKKHGSRENALQAQKFFREPITTHGWRTADVDCYARELFNEVKADPQLVAALAEKLSQEKSNEEFQIAICLLQRPSANIHRHFAQCTRMLDRVDNWGKCDSLAARLLGPALLQEPKYLKTVVKWTTSKNHWKRRAAAASLVIAARRKKFHDEIFRIADRLADDPDLMVQKGLGWLLRELGKASPQVAISCLQKVHGRASRLVLRTACEKLSPADKRTILAR